MISVSSYTPGAITAAVIGTCLFVIVVAVLAYQSFRRKP